MRRVFVVGNATLDCLQSVARLPVPGETLLSASLLRCPGGKGLNQAIACARTGASTVLVAPVGDDGDGAMLRAAASSEDNLEARWIASMAPTDYSAIWVAADGENMIVSSAAAARGLTEADALEALHDLASKDLLLLQGNLTAAVTMAVASYGRKRGALTLLNTAPIAWDLGPALPLFDVVIANAVEATALTGEDARASVLVLAPGEQRIACVTLGGGGAVMAQDNRVTTAPAPVVDTVDTAGAGDVFVGVLAGAMCDGSTAERALRCAVLAASIAVTRPGTVPSFPTRAEMARIFER